MIFFREILLPRANSISRKNGLTTIFQSIIFFASFPKGRYIEHFVRKNLLFSKWPVFFEAFLTLWF